MQPSSKFDAQHFDYSEPVMLSVTAFGAMPYRPFASREDYHLSAGRSAAYAQSHTHTHSQPFYVEPFEAEDAGVADPSTAPSTEEAARYEDVEIGGQPGSSPRPAAPVVEGDRAARLAEQERRESEEFEADIRQILEGKKRYEASQRNGPGTTIEAPRTAPTAARGPAPAPAPASAREEPPKDEHAIFEKIAQSMKLANAYDLGSVALNQRLDAFDREMEASRRRQSAAANPPAPAQRTTEFLEDMDEIGQGGATPSEQQIGEAPGAGKRGAATVSNGSGGSATPGESEKTNHASAPAGPMQGDAGMPPSASGDDDESTSS